MKHGMKKGALDRYFVASKPSAKEKTGTTSDHPAKKVTEQPQLPPVYLAPSLGKLPLSQKISTKDTLRPRREYRKAFPSGDRYCQISPKPANPWAATQPNSSQTSSTTVANV